MAKPRPLRVRIGIACLAVAGLLLACFIALSVAKLSFISPWPRNIGMPLFFLLFAVGLLLILRWKDNTLWRFLLRVFAALIALVCLLLACLTGCNAQYGGPEAVFYSVSPQGTNCAVAIIFGDRGSRGPTIVYPVRFGVLYRDDIKRCPSYSLAPKPESLIWLDENTLFVDYQHLEINASDCDISTHTITF